MNIEESKIFIAARKIAKKISEKGYEAFFVGGFVRDYLMGVMPYDIDVVTNASVDKIVEILPIAHKCGKSFGIVSAVESGIITEVATFREEEEYLDFRRPSCVRPGNIHTDAIRRDFTCNGIYMNPEDLSIIDIVDGRKDIENRIIRMIGSPDDRIKEDRLRILRAFRFSATLKFSIEENTLKALHKYDILPWVSKERIKEEIIKSDNKKVLVEFIQKLYNNNILHKIFNEEFIPDFSESTVNYINNHPELSLVLKLILLFSNNCLCINNYIKLTNIEKSQIDMYNTFLNFILNEDKDPVKLILSINQYWYMHCFDIAYFIGFKTNPESAIYIKELIEQHKDTILKKLRGESPITGKMIKEKGINPGPQYSKIINKSWDFNIRQNMSYNDIKDKLDDIINDLAVED